MNVIKLFDVQDTFAIDAGQVIVGNVEVDVTQPTKGQKLRIVTKNGSRFEVEVVEYGEFTKCFSRTQAVGILISQIGTESQITRGDQVWVLEQ